MDAETFRIAFTAGSITLGAIFVRWAVATYREGKRLDKFKLSAGRNGTTKTNSRRDRPK